MESNYEIYLKTDLEKYRGQWIAICDKGIVARGSNAKEVYKDAINKFPNKKIMLVKVPEDEAMIFSLIKW